LTQGYVEAAVDDCLRGNVVYFDSPSVTGTENLLMAAVRARGETVIKNAAREPEVGNLIDMLTAMGAEIHGKDTDRLTIHGVGRLQPAVISIIPDRIEVGTYMIAVAAAGGEVTITDCIPAHLPSLVEKLRSAGVQVLEHDSAFTVSGAPTGEENMSSLRSVDIRTMPYPGFPTDLQAQFMALMTMADGVSVIHETIFENRFMHVAELQRMAGDIKIDGSTAIVTGKKRGGLCGAQVMATDLRASASLVIAGLAAKGVTEISRIYHLERGYENMVGKLQGLGAAIRIVKE
jgi:UDP-N-acetylglucosamine 1-carboxyvinyltransferase